MNSAVNGAVNRAANSRVNTWSALLTPLVIFCVWLAYSGPPMPRIEQLFPLLALVGVLFLVLLRLRHQTLPPALFGAIWFGLNPANLETLADSSHHFLIWWTAGAVAGLGIWLWWPEHRRTGVFLFPLLASSVGFRSELASLRLFSGLDERALISLLAIAAAIYSLRWRHARALTLGLGWYGLMSLVLPAQPLPGLVGAALALSWLLSRLIDLLPRAEVRLVGIAALAWLLLQAVAISRVGVPDSSALTSAPTAEAAQLLDLSLSLFQQGRYEESIAAAQGAAKLKPDYAEAYNNIAAGYNALKQWDAGIQAAQTALAIKPDFQRARNNLEWAKQQKRLESR